MYTLHIAFTLRFQYDRMSSRERKKWRPDNTFRWRGFHVTRTSSAHDREELEEEGRVQTPLARVSCSRENDWTYSVRKIVFMYIQYYVASVHVHVYVRD